MTGRVTYTPVAPHQCFMFWPLEAGLFAPLGTRWVCDDCGTTWVRDAEIGWRRV